MKFCDSKCKLGVDWKGVSEIRVKEVLVMNKVSSSWVCHYLASFAAADMFSLQRARFLNGRAIIATYPTYARPLRRDMGPHSAPAIVEEPIIEVDRR
ncbi:hypothetical protein HAX54_002787 [Datura stramonium]|uniref:Uncharacterized protein n=1 Tax=Datura stramonium TaxID=4076 RepID=A0ABS8T5F3_DATST|nr:hypothetical protein [Datura stramonium]